MFLLKRKRMSVYPREAYVRVSDSGADWDGAPRENATRFITVQDLLAFVVRRAIWRNDRAGGADTVLKAYEWDFEIEVVELDAPPVVYTLKKVATLE